MFLFCKRSHIGCTQNDKRVCFLSCELIYLKGCSWVSEDRHASSLLAQALSAGSSHHVVVLPVYPDHDDDKPLSTDDTASGVQCPLTARWAKPGFLLRSSFGIMLDKFLVCPIKHASLATCPRVYQSIKLIPCPVLSQVPNGQY